MMPYQIFRIDRAPEAKPIEAKRIERLLTKYHPVSEWAVRERTEEIATLKAEVERLKGCVLTQNKIIIMQMDEISTLKAKVVELEERLRVENRDVVSADEYATLKAELAKAKEQDYCTLCGESLDCDKQTVIDTLKAENQKLREALEKIFSIICRDVDHEENWMFTELQEIEIVAGCALGEKDYVDGKVKVQAPTEEPDNG